MPLIIVGKGSGSVIYKKPVGDEVPRIGRLIYLNEIVHQHKRERAVRELSHSMALLQLTLLERK
jgi:hypothetical protein